MVWDVFLSAIGVVIGYFAALNYDRTKTQNAFLEAHKLSMNALVSSLKRNSEYIHQMFTVEFPAGFYPSYPLDTVALALINFGARPILPSNTEWPAKFNVLRFEMDHINRKLLLNFCSGDRIDPAYVKTTYDHYTATGQPPDVSSTHPLSKIFHLLLAAKTALDEQVQELERHGFRGECVKPY